MFNKPSLFNAEEMQFLNQLKKNSNSLEWFSKNININLSWEFIDIIWSSLKYIEALKDKLNNNNILQTNTILLKGAGFDKIVGCSGNIEEILLFLEHYGCISESSTYSGITFKRNIDYIWNYY